MKLSFSLPYVAQWGENLCVELVLLGSRRREVKHILRMETQDGILWATDYNVHETDIRQFRYHYSVRRGDELVRQEWRRVPRLFSAEANRHFVMNDFWMETPPEPWRFDEAFLPAAARVADINTPTFGQTILFRVLAPALQQGQAVALLGSQPPLGDWRPLRALRLTPSAVGEWRLAISAAALQQPFEYKYVIVDAESGELVAWEEGRNRRIGIVRDVAMPLSELSKPASLSSQSLTTIIRNDGLVRLAANSIATTEEEEEDADSPETDAAVLVLEPLEALLTAAEEAGLKAVSLQTLEETMDLARANIK